MRRTVVAVAVALLVVAAAVVRVFVYPPSAAVGPSDAVAVLAGDAEARLPVAVRLAAAGAGVLAVSVDDGEDNAPARALCENPGGLEVHCFTAARSDTRAEARALGRLIDEQQWDTVAVVTNSYHVARAGVLVGRCTDASVRVVDARSDMPVRRWVVAIARETAGLVVAAAQRSC